MTTEAAMKPTPSEAAQTPAQIYLATLSAGSRQGMRQALDVVANIISSGAGADSHPWHTVTYRETVAIRLKLAERYRPASVITSPKRASPMKNNYVSEPPCSTASTTCRRWRYL